MDGGAYAYDEGLASDAADDEFGVVVFLGMDAACDGFIAGGGEGRALGRALREVRGELFGDVGHEVDGNAEFVGRGALLAGKLADSGALIVDLDGNRDGAAEDSACGGFIEPGALRLRMADGGREQREV